MSEHRVAFAVAKDKPLEIGKLATPSPKPYEVLVKHKAIAINPVDWKRRDYGAYISKWPAVLGGDASGEVEAVGSDVKSVKVGDRVAGYYYFTQGDAYSSFQEKGLLWEDLLIKLPESVSFEAGSTLGLTYSTAVVGLGLDLGLPLPWVSSDSDAKSSPIVVLGGSSSVGQYALQLLRNAGYKNIITTASARNHALVKKFGATTAVDQSAPDVEKQIKDAAGGPIGYVFDTIALQDTQELAAKVIKSDGKVVLTMGPKEDIGLPKGAKGTWALDVYDFTSQSPGDGKNPSHYEFGKAAFAYLSKSLADGSIVPNKARVVDGSQDLAKALEEGLQLNKKGLSGEKAVISLT